MDVKFGLYPSGKNRDCVTECSAKYMDLGKDVTGVWRKLNNE
jgi:hypothetical protein